MLHTLIPLAIVGASLAGCAQAPKSVSTRLAKPTVTTMQFAQGRKGWEPCYDKAVETKASADELNLKIQTFKDLPAVADPPHAMEGILCESQMHLSRLKALQALAQEKCAQSPQELAAYYEATAIQEKIVDFQTRINNGAGVVAVRNILIGPR
jgi:hypothetical protein